MQHKFIFCRTEFNYLIPNWKKAFFPVFFLCAIACGGTFASALQAAEFAGGDGTDNNPWKIKTREHLSSLTNYIGTAGVGKFFRLENDITFAEEDFAPGGAFYNNGAGWVPIGHRRVSNRMFSGNFDGKGYAIRNLVIHRPTSADVGFFGFTKNATISNLRIEGVFFNGATNVAALAGTDESSLFSNCSASGTVNGMKTVAGLVGYTQEGVFLRCGASCTVSASLISTGFTDISTAGGLLAYAENVSLDECYALGSLSCATSAYAEHASGTAYAGGLVGYLHSSTVSSSMAKGSVTLSTADADFSGDGYAGGLIGYMHISSVQDSYATGHVSANTVPRGQSIPISGMGKGYIGGLCGFSLSSSVSKSYASGACSVISGTTSAYAGGIVGASSFSQISSSVALNNSIQCNSDTFPIESHAGRIEAVSAAAFSDNLATTLLILKANNSVLTPVDDLEGKDGGSTSPEVLKTTLPYESLGWDLTTVWDHTAVDYPVLAWEKEIFVTQAPKIISQPQSLDVIEGQEAVFEVTATGGALSYIWTHNGKVIRDETQPRLAIESAQISNQGVYVVTVSNSKGSVESSPVTLTIVNVPSITEHPQNKVLNPGNLLDLNVTATGTPPLYYQWYKDGELVQDATSPQFTVPSVKESDAGSYTVVVSNAVGSVTSNPAKVTVKEEPPITEFYLFNPLLILEEGKLYLVFEVKGATIFNVEGSIDGEHWVDAAYTLTDEGKVKVLASQQYIFYRAFAEGTPADIAPEITSSPQNVDLFVGDKLDLSITATGTQPLNYQWYKGGEPIPGAASPQLTIPSVTEVDAGIYTVVVSNTAGSATSNPAKVTVKEEPPVTEIYLFNPLLILEEGKLYLVFEVKGTTIFNVEKSIDGEHWVDAAYTLTAEGEVKILASQQHIFYRAIAEGTPVDIAPEITSSPQNVDLFVGDKLDLSVTATGTPPLNYQWYKDGELVQNATSPQFTVPNVTEVDAGIYTVVVSNTAGSATSNPAKVNVYGLPVEEVVLLDPTIKDDKHFSFYLEIPAWVTQDMIQVWHKTPRTDWIIEKNASIDFSRNEVLVPLISDSALYRVVIVGSP